MIAGHTHKVLQVIAPAAITDNASFTTNEIDTLGYKRATIYFMLGATDIAMAALKVQESDTAGSGHADITGATFAGSLPSATDDNKIFAFDIALDGTRKRYLDLVATAGDGATGTYATAWVELHGAEIVPSTAAGRGINGALVTV